MAWSRQNQACCAQFSCHPDTLQGLSRTVFNPGNAGIGTNTRAAALDVMGTYLLLPSNMHMGHMICCEYSG